MDEFGYLGVVKQLLGDHLVPIVCTALPQFRNVVRFRDVYAKIVKYSAAADATLDRDWPVHIDESDVTINLCVREGCLGGRQSVLHNRAIPQPLHGLPCNWCCCPLPAGAWGLTS